MPGAVIEAHAKIENDCDQCHVSFDQAAQPRVCLACHDKVAADVRAHRGFHGRNKDAQCRDCHTDHKGRDAKIAEFDFNTFDHAHTDFPLSGKHLTPKCEQCHKPGNKYREATASCDGCHRKDDIHATRFGRDCAECHNSDGWAVAKFDHSRTQFKLSGHHVETECKDCHTRGYREQRLAMECVSCHRKDDKHRGSLGDDCAKCHTDSLWRDTRFDHQSTGFALVGKHVDTDCKSCHKTATDFKGAPRACSGCHRDDDRHAGTLGNACETCHTAQAWKPSRGFDHAHTKFALTGKHKIAECATCHADAKHYRDTSRDCVACHRKDDKHKGHNGDACADCHGSEDWKRSRFDHDKQTEFVLRGAHRKVICEDCHKGALHKEKLPVTCAECHREKDPHRGKLGATCTDCHDEAAWNPAQFDHDKVAFVLLGAHRVVTCTKCHATALYRDTAKTCDGCHAKDDSHHGALGSDCARCHNTRDWRLGEFNHSTQTKFALDGAHASLSCATCHRDASGRAPSIANDCASCHAGDDVHEGAFGRQCRTCHITKTFRQIVHSSMKGKQ